MRCRRLSHRYAVFITRQEFRLLTEGNWKTEKIKMAKAHSYWYPATDIYETDVMIYITVELAGVKPDNIDITIYKDALIIEGQRHLAVNGQEGFYHIAEISQGPFRLELLLPVVIDPDQTEVQCEQGILKLTLAKIEGGKTYGS